MRRDVCAKPRSVRVPMTENPTESVSVSTLDGHAIDKRDEPIRYPDRELGRAGDAAAGASLVVIGGVHGNEPAGLIAGQRVLDAIAQNPNLELNGQLVVLAGNLSALNDHDPDSRYIEHDLNRLCTREDFGLDSSASSEHREMHELFDSLESIHRQAAQCKRSMIVLDLHTTSAQSRPVVVFEDSLAARSHAMRMPCPKYLGIEEELDGLVIDAVTNRLGCVSYLIEGGQHDDPVSVEVHEAAIWIALDAAGICSLSQLEFDPMETMRRASLNRGDVIYDVRHREPIASESFEIAKGIENGTPAVAFKTVLAIQNGEPVHSPIHGLVFLPNRQAHKRVNDDGFFIVRRVSAGWVNLSARVRTKDWIHQCIAALPGVYSAEDSTLFVDGDIACVLRRQVFHLFGYRLIRHDGRKGSTGIRRVIHIAKAFLKALFKGPNHGPDGVGPDASDHRFWIVQRRLLDR